MIRSFFVVCLALVVGIGSADAQMPKDKEIKFQILRDGNPFGMHKLHFRETDDGMTAVDIKINMSVSFGPINFFKYEHENTEIWDGDQLISISSETNDNGDDYMVKASWQPDGVAVTNQERSFEALPDIYTTSYWNDKSVKANKLLNTQKGKVENVVTEDLGVEEFETAVETLQARHFKIVSDTLDYPIHIWYDTKTDQWVGLKFKVRGSELRYKRLDIVE